MSNPLVYLAGPISDVSFEEATSWRVIATEMLATYSIATLNPLRGKHLFLAHQPAGAVEKAATEFGITPQQIVMRDKGDIRKCDLVIVNLLDVRKRGMMVFGSTMEIIYAWEQGKPVIIIANDVGSPWLTYHSIRVVPTIADAVMVAKQYLGGM